MLEKIYQPGEMYQYPLILKKLLNTPLIYSPDQEIVYRDQLRYLPRPEQRLFGRPCAVKSLSGFGRVP